MSYGNRHLIRFCFLAGLTLAVAAQVSPAQVFIGGRGGAGMQVVAKGMVRLPYRSPEADASGNQWFIYPGGWVRHVGQMPIYSEGGVLTVNGAQPGMNSNQARLDDNGELIFENMQANGCTITRRLQINKDDGYIRMIDIVKNTSGQDQQISLSYRSSFNFGLQGSQSIGDSKKKDQSMGVIGQDGQGRNFLELYAGRGSRIVPEINAQPNNNQIQATLTVSVKAGKEVAVLHIHSIVASNDAGVKFVAGLKESQLLKDVPKQVRRLICNFAGGNSFIAEEMEILRGEAFDVVEMRGGDFFKGTLRDPAWKLNAFYGPVELPADKVISIANVGDVRPRQLLVTTDGEISGGTLTKPTVALELASGQIMQIPLSQISRIGYRRRSGETEEWTFEKPMVVRRSGERIEVEMPSADVEVATRYGSLKLKPQIIAAISFRNEETGLPTVYLTDGSKFAALVVPDSFEMKLANTPGSPLVRFPTSTLAKLQLTTKTDDIDDTTPVVKLANDDLMVGSLTGDYNLDMAFDTLALSGRQIKKIVHSKGAPLDVQVTLWDDTIVTGQLEQQALVFGLRSGLPFRVPLALLSEYNQPEPTPSDSTAKEVGDLVQTLNSDGWKDRDAAQAKLIAMGPAICGILKDQRPGQSPEVQQRIDTILGILKNAGNAPPGGITHQQTTDPDE